MAGDAIIGLRETVITGAGEIIGILVTVITGVGVGMAGTVGTTDVMAGTVADIGAHQDIGSE